MTAEISAKIVAAAFIKRISRYNGIFQMGDHHAKMCAVPFGKTEPTPEGIPDHGDTPAVFQTAVGIVIGNFPARAADSRHISS